VIVFLAEERQGKKMKILEEFWYGNIHPTDRNIVPNSKMDRLLKLVVENEQRLNELLSEEERAVFQNSKTATISCPA